VNFFYQGNDTKPYFIQSLPQTGSENVGLDTYVTYGADGKKVRDSSIQIHLVCGRVQHLANYAYTANMVYVQYDLNRIEPYVCTPAPNAVKNFDTIYLSYNNVTKVVGNGSQNTSFKNSISYTYDKKINPFRQLNIFSSFYTLGFDVGYRYWSPWDVPADALYILGLNENNVTGLQLGNDPYNQQFAQARVLHLSIS
jgi:hypothetical protein